MKVCILVGNRFNAGLVASNLGSLGLELEIITSSKPSGWGECSSSVRFNPMPFSILSKIFNFNKSRNQKDFDTYFFSKTSSLFFNEYDVLHGWASFSFHSAVKQKKNGGIFYLDRACPHIDFQESLLEEESELTGINFSKMSPKIKDLMLNEYELADKILVPSNYSLRSFANRGFPKDKLCKISLDANLAKYPVVTPTGPDKDCFVVGCVGGNILRKGIYYLIMAWINLNLPNAKLLLKISWSELEKHPLLLSRIKASDNIHVMQYFENISDFYSQLDVFCLPSIDDGFGMVCLEAMAHSLPVICTENVGASEFIDNGSNGYVVPIRNPDAIASCIYRFYADKDHAKQLGLRALDSYTAYLASPSSYKESLKNLYFN